LAAVAEADAADEEAEPVADEAALEVADPADPAVEEAAAPEETGLGTPKVPPVPMTTVGVTIVTFLAALMKSVMVFPELLVDSQLADCYILE
jgi:hypothetical protein